MFKHMIRLFIRSEEGAVTVDWVVLTAAICGLGMAVALALGPSMVTSSGGLVRSLETDMVVTDFETEITIDKKVDGAGSGGSGGQSNANPPS